MNVSVVECNEVDSDLWDRYIRMNGRATVYHAWGWKRVIEKTYGHRTFYLGAYDDETPGRFSGVLPLVFISHFIFGRKLISIPYFDMGGIVADSERSEKALACAAVSVAQQLNAELVELRQTGCKAWLESKPLPFGSGGHSVGLESRKARMVLALPESSEALMKSFKSKLRSQIRKPLNEGLKATIGGMEQLDVFYRVFVENMRDLGSPVHSRAMIRNTLLEMGGNARTIIVSKNGKPLAGGLIVGFKETMANPWASSLRRYSRFSPNMLLYWAMLAYASDHGYKRFDFGRSTPGEGTYKFKEQWGATPEPLHWYSISDREMDSAQDSYGRDKFDKAIEYWKKLPVPVTMVMGPAIRRYIGL